MNQDTIDLLDEAVELTGIAEAWRDKAETYHRRAVYAEGQWLALDEEVMRLRREVVRGIDGECRCHANAAAGMPLEERV